MKSLLTDRFIQLVLIVFIALSGWWLYLQLNISDHTDPKFQLFAAVYGVVALIGAVWGLIIARHWGGWRSQMGRVLILFSLGLLAQEFGQLSYSYYIYFLKQDVPYPSIGDIGYFGSVLFYIAATWELAAVSGAKITLSSYKNKIVAVVLPALILFGSYYIFLKDYTFDSTQPLKTFLDFGYPLGQAFYISLALLTFLLSRKLLGGIMRPKIFLILLALCAQYAADFSFLYQSSHSQWYAGGSNDYVYLVAYTLMAIALSHFDTKKLKLGEK
jgi:hypothetical protein